MHIAKYGTWLKMGSIGKLHDSTPLKLKDVGVCGDAKLLAKAMNSYMRVDDLNNGNCGLEDWKLFECTKRQLDLPHRVDYNSHQPNKVVYYFLHPNTRGKNV